MEFTSSDSIWELMLTKRPSDTHFSQSSAPGGKSPLARDDDNMLNTHAVLFDGTKTALVILGAGVALGVAAAPYVKSGLSSLKSKLRRRAEETTDGQPPFPSRSLRRSSRSSLAPLDCALSEGVLSGESPDRVDGPSPPGGSGKQVRGQRLGFSQAAFLHAARKATLWRIRTVGGGGTGIEGATEGEAWVRRGAGAATGSTWPTR